MEQNKNAYFDKFESKKIFEYYNKDPYYMVSRLENYIEEYPNDYSMLFDYVSVLIRVNSLEKANSFFKQVEQRYLSDKELDKFPSKKESIYKKYISVKLRLLFYQGKYEKWLNKYDKKMEYIEEKELIMCSLYVRKKLGRLNQNKIPDDRYLYGQIIDYSYEDFKEHIKHHMADERLLIYENSSEEEIMKNSFFNSEFPMDEIIEHLKEIIPDKIEKDKRMNSYYENEYIFKYDCNGRSFNRITDYFKVVTFDNTNEFITMYPILYGDNLPYTDLNYMNKEKPVVKKISMIDKFNKKYHM